MSNSLAIAYEIVRIIAAIALVVTAFTGPNALFFLLLAFVGVTLVVSLIRSDQGM